MAPHVPESLGHFLDRPRLPLVEGAGCGCLKVESHWQSVFLSQRSKGKDALVPALLAAPVLFTLL
jgi:hypothetical protein